MARIIILFLFGMLLYTQFRLFWSNVRHNYNTWWVFCYVQAVLSMAVFAFFPRISWGYWDFVIATVSFIWGTHDILRYGWNVEVKVR